MSATYPYVQSTDKFKEFLSKIKEIGIPNEVSTKQLKSLGYTSSNDERFLSAIKFIKLVEDKRGGGPTELWKEMRVNFGKAIAKGMKQGYSDLFSQYPDAYRRDDEALTSFFAAHTTAGADAVRKMVNTFKALSDVATFDEEGGEADDIHEETKGPDRSGIKGRHREMSFSNAAGMTVNINVQLQVPPDATGEIYDKFFEAMKKHLMSEK